MSRFTWLCGFPQNEHLQFIVFIVFAHISTPTLSISYHLIYETVPYRLVCGHEVVSVSIP